MGDALAVCLLKYRNFSVDDFARFHPGGSLGKKIYMRVKDLYGKTDAPRVSPTTSINDTIIEILSRRHGATAVTDAEMNLVGIITDGDLRRMLERHKDFSQLTASDIMNSTPKTIAEEELAINAFNIMEDKCITQLIVTDGTKYSGIIHLHDILKEGIM